MIADLSGRKAIVTGAGTVQGLGAAIAAVLADQGADVAVADVNMIEAVKVAADLATAGSFAVELDVGSDESVQAAFAEVESGSDESTSS